MPKLPAWPERPLRQRPSRLGDLSGGQISIEQALIAAGVNLLLPFGPAFCFAVIVCFSLEYKILGLAGGTLVAAGVNPLAPFYINPLVPFYINPLAPFYINPLVPFYINAQPPWPGLDLLFLLDQAKRRSSFRLQLLS